MTINPSSGGALKTYADLIGDAAQKLAAAGIETPRREARLLAALAAGTDAAALIARERDRVPEEICLRLEALVARRAAREPFAHIAGERSFYGLDFICDARALVPRPDSEIVVEAALEKLEGGRSGQIADLGTGSGCLLIAILMQRAGLSGVGVERDPDAATLARENVQRHVLEERCNIEIANWSDWTGWSEVDLIISNPPYIASSVIEELEPDVRLFDPLQALDGGLDGLEAYRSLIGIGARQMKPGAWLVLEIGYDQDEPVRELLDQNGFVDVEGRRDLGGHNRVVLGKQPHG